MIDHDVKMSKQSRVVIVPTPVTPEDPCSPQDIDQSSSKLYSSYIELQFIKSSIIGMLDRITCQNKYNKIPQS